MKKVCLLAFAMCVGMGLTTHTASSAIIVNDTGTGWYAASATANPVNTTVVTQGVSAVHGVGVPGGTSYGVELEGAATTTGIRDDLVYTTTDVTGINLIDSGVFLVKFDFYASNAVPEALFLYFLAGSFSWYYNLSSPSPNDWTQYQVFLTSPGWFSDDGGGFDTDAFLAAIAIDDITRAGVRIEYPLNSGPFYLGIGNFEYHIPEPGTYMMLSTALISLGYTFARRGHEQKKVA